MFLQQLVNGLTIGSTYALVAIGFTLIFGVLELINFANGSVYILGAYFTVMIHQAMQGNFFLAFFMAIILNGVVGFCIDRFVLRILRNKGAPKLSSLIATIGIQTIIDNCILLFFGSETKPVPNVLDLGTFHLGNAIVSWLQVIILCTAIVLMIVVSILLYRTKIGKAMRSTSQNAEAARLMGINVPGVISFTFMLSSALSAIAGTLVGMYYQAIDVTMGTSVGSKTFASALLGGVGILPGAIVGGLVVGVVETIAASYISSGYRDAIAFAILLIVLLVKPTGFFGQKIINKV